MDLKNLTIEKAHQGFKNKDFSVNELTQAYLKNIKKKNKRLNAFISVFENDALERAKKIDSEIFSQGVKNYLTGIPFSIKDNILIKGKKCTAGSKILENYQASYNAAVIDKLEKNGAIFLGKTNLDEFAMGGSTENSAFGPTKNPYDLNRVPGGSSGGSAAAVSAQMCLASLGSDTGGSIRQPASFCGVVGFKPSYGRVSRYGLIAMASSLDQIGPIVNCVEDAKIVLNAIQGKDEKDSTSVESNKIDSLNNLDLKNIKIGLPKEYFIQGLDSEIKKKIEKLADKLENQGAKIEQVSLPHTKYALACYYLIMPAEVSANLSRYDGIKYGFLEKGKNLLETYLNTRTHGFGETRTLIKQDFEKVFNEQKIDCLLTPTTPTIAFKLGEKVKNPLEMYLSDVYTVSVNLAGLPGISLPIGEVKKMPVGAQLIGDYFQEEKLLKIAHLIGDCPHFLPPANPL